MNIRGQSAPVAATPDPVTTPAVSLRHVWTLLLCCAASWVPALVGHTVVARVTALHPLGASPQPYFQPEHAWLLYVVTPVVILSSFSLYLAPGALLTLALSQARHLAEWFALAFGASVLCSVLLSTGAQLLLGTPLPARLFLGLWLATAGLAGGILALRRARGQGIPWPLGQAAERRRLGWMVVATLAGVAALLPKIFWENFNIDGIEAFEFGRSLSTHPLPHWDLYDGIFGFYHNFVLFAYPNHWFITLFGPYEAAARVPFLLYVVGLFPALLLLIEHGTQGRLGRSEEAILWCGLGLYTVVQAYNTNYEPFFADLAEMAATDSLWIWCFLATCYALWRQRWGWFWAFALMTHLASPGTLLLFAGMAVMTFRSHTPHWRRHTWALAGVLGVCILLGLLYTSVYNPLVIGGAHDQFSAKNMFRRLYPPTVTEFVRFSALLFPSGLLPALALLWARRHDHPTWCLAGVTLITFGVLYLQAWTSLHQFTPVMILPLVVFWRLYLQTAWTKQRWLLLAISITTAGILVLSLPRHFQINHAIRDFGQASVYNIGHYDHAYEAAGKAATSVYVLLPRDYRIEYPQQPWGVDAYAWLYYATRDKLPGAVVNYVIQAASEPPPSGLFHVATNNDVAVYVRDRELWQQHRQPDLPRVVISPLYEPILRRTYAFFRAYVARSQSQEQQSTTPQTR